MDYDVNGAIPDAGRIEPVPDLARLRKVVEWVEWQALIPEVDREWDQDRWRTSGALIGRNCDTCFCVAGKVCDDAGIVWNGVGSDYGILDGITDDAEDHAIRLLGLTGWQASHLFTGSNKASDVRRVAEDIAANVGERL